MKRTLKVFAGDKPKWVGTLHYDAAVGSRERSAFAYAETWLGTADRFALEPALPLVTGPQFHRKAQNGSVFHGAFADTEPDGWARGVICATMPIAARQSAGPVKNRKPFHCRPLIFCSQWTMPAVSVRCVFRTRREFFAGRQNRVAGPLLRSSN